MNLGEFSISINVRNMDESIPFHTNPGFRIIDGGQINQSLKDHTTMKWRIPKSSVAKTGLFQGMFDHNILTFYSRDLMNIQSILKEKDMPFIKEAKDRPGEICSISSPMETKLCLKNKTMNKYGKAAI